MRRSSRALIVGGLVIAAALAFILYQGLSNNLVYYITPSELLARGAAAQGQDFRLGGQVRPGSVHVSHGMHTVTFILQDPRGAVHVISEGIPPPMFRAGAGVVVEGIYRGDIFNATTLMVKHCATYRPPTPGTVPAPDNCVT
ncbi:MAG TPA: cytochrome c maturation protein CcmE [Chloroflexota bacterium]|nr:cytochrome c maturation protein CcmE [Chloroflexota bacterium]